MRIKEAVLAFCRQLNPNFTACSHPQVPFAPQGQQHCPDCGYQVSFLWSLLICEDCGTRFESHLAFPGGISATHSHCKHCGGKEKRLVQKTSVSIQEIPYAVCEKVTQYKDKREKTRQKPYASRPHYEAKNPFKMVQEHIVEGQVLRKRYLA